MGFSNEDSTRTCFPYDAFSVSMTLAAAGLGWSGADKSLYAGISAAFGTVNVTSEGKSDQLSVIFPAVYLDMYFFNRSALFLGGGLEVRYSSVDLKRTFAMDFDDVSGTEDHMADMPRAGEGYQLSPKGKYLFENNPLIINFGWDISMTEGNCRHSSSIALKPNLTAGQMRMNLHSADWRLIWD